MTRRGAATIAGAGLLIAVTGALAFIFGGVRHAPAPPRTPLPPLAGSARCRDCHADFYRRWSQSRHGLAMQPFSTMVAREQLAPQQQDVVVAGHRFRADVAAGRVRETSPGGEIEHPIADVMGGKDVYFFLTPYERGRLQVLPVAYDVRRKEWYDVAASALRHFTDVPEKAVHWTDPELTFNASCHGCHVSQLSSNYDVSTDSYRTTWAEPGINCETCHGSGEKHVRAVEPGGTGKVPGDLKLIATAGFTHEQKNDLCAPCHAKMSPLTNGGYRPGDRYFDAFDLVGLESRDFHPDGRDLGENYTFTGWRGSACARSGQLDCLHCHTSSGGYRFKEAASANQACLPCHEARVQEGAAHSHHPDGQTTCTDCHMPKTDFARIARSDHSMRPPAPAATAAFGSPNACNLCHRDKSAAWSDRAVRKWYARDYQAPVLRRGAVIAAARAGDWSKLPAMLAAVRGPERDEVTAASLLRLLRSCPSDEKQPAILAALRDPSPWVRAAAAETAGEHLTADVVPALLAAIRDPVRLPRVRAADALAGVPAAAVPAGARADLDAATRELEASLTARLDDFASQCNLARLYERRGDTARAIAAYEIAIRLRPDVAIPLVNVSLLYNKVSRNVDAESVLRRALAIDPHSAAAHLNLGLLLGELRRFPEAEAALRAAFKEDGQSAAVAYNLAVLVGRDRPDDAAVLSHRASDLEPASAKYAFTWAFYLAQSGDQRAATAVLRRAIDRGVRSSEITSLLDRLTSDRKPRP
jgi:tetratricopeptide (TPR) repeat protein